MILAQNCSMKVSEDADPKLARDINIRLAVAGDAAGIAALLADSFTEYRSQYTEQGFDATAITAEQVINRLTEGPIWIALHDNTIVGTVAAVRRGDSLYVRSMAVHPAARGRRLGARLLKQIEDYATTEGLHRLFLSTTPFLDRAIALYQKAGFYRVDEGPHDLFGTPLFTMEKWLTPSA
jgi:N-acetylglutamate synthase-like GNAT family acetyltransferase